MLKMEFFLFCLKVVMVWNGYLLCAYKCQEGQKLRKDGPTSSGTANHPEFTISIHR